jgi:hypothetical protein
MGGMATIYRPDLAELLPKMDGALDVLHWLVEHPDLSDDKRKHAKELMDWFIQHRAETERNVGTP